MPLIIAVLIVIVIISCVRNSNKELFRRNKEYTASARKTNAEMERGLVDWYMKRGKSFDDAFQLSKEDMQRAGFEPCIPKDAYKLKIGNSDNIETSECYGYERFDSTAVKNLKQDYRNQCRQKGVEWTKEGECEYVYSEKLPVSAAQYAAYLHRQNTTHQHESVAVGKYFSYLGLGTCEVIALDFEHAMHTVKVLSTGEVRQIPFGDKKITKL